MKCDSDSFCQHNPRFLPRFMMGREILNLIAHSTLLIHLKGIFKKWREGRERRRQGAGGVDTLCGRVEKTSYSHEKPHMQVFGVRLYFTY